MDDKAKLREGIARDEERQRKKRENQVSLAKPQAATLILVQEELVLQQQLEARYRTAEREKNV